MIKFMYSCENLYCTVHIDGYIFSGNSPCILECRKDPSMMELVARLSIERAIDVGYSIIEINSLEVSSTL